MNRKHMKWIICNVLLWISLLSSKANELLIPGIDTAYKEQIIKAGTEKLNALILQNENYIKAGKTDKLSFVVNVNPEDYIADISLNNKPNFLSSATVEGGYNARLNQVFQSEGIECYFILINYFDVKMTAEMPTTYLLSDIFSAGTFFDKNSNIQTLKSYHSSITNNILSASSGSNRKRYAVSFANYYSAEFNNSTGGTGCFRLYTVHKVEPSNSPVIAYFDDIYNYYKGYLRKDQIFLNETSRDLIVDKMITDFEKSVKNYKKKALIVHTNTINDLKTILSFFSNEDYQLLSNKERTHIFKIFCGGAIWHTTEIEILNVLNTVPRDSANIILTDLISVDVNGKRLLKHFFDGFQQGNYQDMVKRITQLVGNSTLYQHNLPDVETALIQNQISPAWSKVFEWSDCSTSTMYFDEQNTDECKRPSHWKHAEKRYHTITMSNIGMVEINGKYKNVTNSIDANGQTVVEIKDITPSSLHPYDLVFLVDKSTIDGLNDITDNSGGTMVVPACFLVYAKDKAFNRDLFEATMALTSVVGPEEILASKLISKLPGFKRLLKFVRKADVLVGLADDLVRGVSKTSFKSSFSASDEIAEQAWLLFKEEKWTELENLINVNQLNGGWPPNYGFKNITKVENSSDLSGKVFDRFQGYENLGGSFASPVYEGEGVGELVFTYDSRALSSQIPENTFYIKFKFKNNLPQGLKFEYGEAIPWFNTMGNADQVKSTINFNNLVEGVHYEVLEKLKFVNGNWISIP